MDVTIADLSPAHHAYIRRQFAQHEANGRLLGKLLSELDLTKGRLWALVPTERADMATSDLEADVIASPLEREELASAIAALLMPRLDSVSPALVMFEHWTATDTAEPTAARAFTVGDSVFDYVRDDEPPERLEQLLLSSLWFPTVGVMARLPGTVDVELRGELDPQAISAIVSNIELVLVGAWDADGYVFWEPHSKSRLATGPGFEQRESSTSGRQ